jgi:hypothetical protein
MIVISDKHSTDYASVESIAYAPILNAAAASAYEAEVSAAEAAASAYEAEASAAEAALYDGPRFDTVAGLVASSRAASGPGAIWQAGGFRYEELPFGTASNLVHLANAAGAVFKVLPNADGGYNFAQMNPVADGVTDDFPKLRKMLDITRPGVWPYTTGIAIFIPNNRFYIGQTIELKAVTRIHGTGSGMPSDDNAGTLIFPPDTAGIVVNRHNTLNGGKEIVPTGAADGSIIEGIRLEGGGGTNTSAHGVWLRARAFGRGLRIHNFAGTGWRPYAASNGTDDFIGNCNNWGLNTARITDCEHGVWAQGYDANAGSTYNVDASNNRRWGILDQTFLGCSTYACHTAGNGVLLGSKPGGPKTAYARFGGLTYHAVPDRTEAEYQSTQPGTNSAIWSQCKGTSYAMDWTGTEALGIFREGGSYCTKGDNNRGGMNDCYSEGGQGLIWLMAQHSLWTGGMMTETPIARGSTITSEFGNVLVFPGLTARAKDGNYGPFVDVTLGGSATNKDILKFSAHAAGGDSLTGDWRIKANTTTGGWFVDQANSSSRVPFYVTGGNSTQPWKFQVADFLIGGGANAALMGRVMDTSFPTSGEYMRGQTLFAARPVAGNYAGFLCTVAGTAGSTAVFKKFGTIEA